MGSCCGREKKLETMSSVWHGKWRPAVLCLFYPCASDTPLVCLSLFSFSFGKSLGKRRVHMCNLICWADSHEWFLLWFPFPPFSSRVVKAVFVMRHLIPRKRGGLSVWNVKNYWTWRDFPAREKKKSLPPWIFFSLLFSDSLDTGGVTWNQKKKGERKTLRFFYQKSFFAILFQGYPYGVPVDKSTGNTCVFK